MNSTSEQKTDLPEILQTTLALAESWQNRANTLRTKDELKQQQMMRRLLNHPSDKTVVMHLVDQTAHHLLLLQFIFGTESVGAVLPAFCESEGCL
jgi:hypothetical protein